MQARVFEKPKAPPHAPTPQTPEFSYSGPAYFFHCNNKTRPECVQRKLFGGPQPGTYRHIVPGAVLFLYNFEKKTIEGPFKAVTELRQNIVPEAWNGRFSWQCQVTKMEEDANVIEFKKRDLQHIVGNGRLGLVCEADQQALIREFIQGGWRPGKAPAPPPSPAYAEAWKRYQQAVKAEDQRVTAENNRIHLERKRITTLNNGIPARKAARAAERRKRKEAKAKLGRPHWLELWKPPKGFANKPGSWKCLNLEAQLRKLQGKDGGGGSAFFNAHGTELSVFRMIQTSGVTIDALLFSRLRAIMQSPFTSEGEDAAPYENLVRQIEIKRKANALDFVDIAIILCGVLTVANFNKGDLMELHREPLLNFLENAVSSKREATSEGITPSWMEVLKACRIAVSVIAGKKTDATNSSLNMLQQLQQLQPTAPDVSAQRWADASSSSAASHKSTNSSSGSSTPVATSQPGVLQQLETLKAASSKMSSKNSSGSSAPLKSSQLGVLQQLETLKKVSSVEKPAKSAPAGKAGVYVPPHLRRNEAEAHPTEEEKPPPPTGPTAAPPPPTEERTNRPTSLDLLGTIIKESSNGGDENGGDAPKRAAPKKFPMNRNLIQMKREIEGIREEHPEVGIFRCRRFGTMVDICVRKAKWSKGTLCRFKSFSKYLDRESLRKVISDVCQQYVFKSLSMRDLEELEVDDDDSEYDHVICYLEENVQEDILRELLESDKGKLPGMSPDESDGMAQIMSEQITAASRDVAVIKKKYAEETLSDESVGIYVQDYERLPNVKYLVYEQNAERGGDRFFLGCYKPHYEMLRNAYKSRAAEAVLFVDPDNAFLHVRMYSLLCRYHMMGELKGGYQASITTEVMEVLKSGEDKRFARGGRSVGLGEGGSCEDEAKRRRGKAPNTAAQSANYLRIAFVLVWGFVTA